MAAGSRGEAVHDVQRRLAALGFEHGDDPPGEFGPATAAAVAAFQRHRGIRVDGVCGSQTWASLVEAGYRLGDRSLYLSHPMLRGDDVAELQRRLGSLGFDSGRVDGILGPRTEQALGEFQRNAGLVVDAVCGPATVAALDRLGGSARADDTVATVREQENHRRGPRSLVGRRIAVGETGGLDALARAVVGALATAGGEVILLQHPDGSEQAARANAFAVDAFLGVALTDHAAAPCTTAYYRSPGGWESAGGRRLAESVQAVVPPVLHATDGGIRGMAVPVLRETRMPAVVAEIGPAAVVVERSAELAGAFTTALRAWVERV